MTDTYELGYQDGVKRAGMTGHEDSPFDVAQINDVNYRAGYRHGFSDARGHIRKIETKHLPD